MNIEPHEWKNKPHVTTTSVKCLLCDDEALAVAVFYAPHGCTCSPNKIQPRCMQHLMRADNTDEEMHMLGDFRIPIPETSGD